MKKIKTNIKDLLIFKNENFVDLRGKLRITYNSKFFEKDFVYEYVTYSKKDVIRGFHFQYKFQQAKLITVLKGEIIDAVIDLRKNSSTFGKTFSLSLTERNSLSIYIPEGFAHAYLGIKDINIIHYKLSNRYYKKYESGIVWNDKDINFKWPNKKMKISVKDEELGDFKSFLSTYKYL
jgi:dTDP-4-dehydrorhamnose 3,5-epimerase